MHEGGVIVAPGLDLSVTFGNESFVESPTDHNCVQIVPEVIATGNVLQHTTIAFEQCHTSAPTPVTPRSFGIVGAYDGHRANVGRIAVDSTWHHFFDINLIGDPVARK